MTARFVTFDQAAEHIRGRSIALVGSGPSVLSNEAGFVDSHQVVVRVNNYKRGFAAGFRCDVHYSFYGNSIRKKAEHLIEDGVRLCMCKCPNARAIESPWHERMNKLNGIDFRYVYALRKDWWFCDTYIPTVERFVETYELMGKHVPTTGFAAILDVLACEPKSLYLTGFDFFVSGKHNVDEPWRAGNPDDPIGHRPEQELDWLCMNARGSTFFSFDQTMRKMINDRQAEMVQ